MHSKNDARQAFTLGTTPNELAQRSLDLSDQFQSEDAAANSEFDSALDLVFEHGLQMSYRWKIFCQLFDSGPENISALNERGGNVFELLQRLILDDLMLSLSRLTDPAVSGKNKNASLRNFLEKAKPRLSGAVIAEVESLQSKLDGLVRNVRVHRDKSLAHSDLNHASKVSALPIVTYDELELAMKYVKEIIIKVAWEAGRSRLRFDIIIPFGCDGYSLIKVLKLGHAANR